MNAVSVACSHGDFRARNAGRDDDAAAAVVEDDVGAVGLGEAWCALVEFLGIHVFDCFDGLRVPGRQPGQPNREKLERLMSTFALMPGESTVEKLIQHLHYTLERTPLAAFTLPVELEHQRSLVSI